MRDDMSTKLVHLTKVVTKIENIGDERWQKYYSPREVLEQILTDRLLIANDGFIRGGHTNSSVCFSEAPISKLLLEVGQENTKYMPFGVLLDKEKIFELGARPVIYQSYASYDELPASHSYRHVTFHYPGVDFTWEREWRNRGNIELTPDTTTVIVPNRDEKDKVIRSVGNDWHYLVLDDLGVSLSNRDWTDIPKSRKLEHL